MRPFFNTESSDNEIETIEENEMSEFENMWNEADEPSESEPMDVETLEEDLSDIDIEINDDQNDTSESDSMDPFEAAELLSESDSLDEEALEDNAIFYKPEMIEI